MKRWCNVGCALGFALACDVERIEVGSRVDEARRSGRLPPTRTSTALTDDDGLAGVVKHGFQAGQRNLSNDVLQSALSKLSLPEPVSRDLTTYLKTLDLDKIATESIPVHALAFLVERHQLNLDDDEQQLESLIRLGLAVPFSSPEMAAQLLESDANSRLLHCVHTHEPQLLMTAYATSILHELQLRGYQCTPVRPRR